MFTESATQSHFALSSIKFLALTTSLLAATPAFAISSSSASLTNLNVTLIDLDPTDAYAPSITWKPYEGDYSYVSGVADLNFSNSTYVDFYNQGSAVFAPVAGSVIGINSAASAEVTGSEFNGNSLYASGYTTGYGNSTLFYVNYYYSQAFQSTYSRVEFTLSPQTQAVFSATANLQVASDYSDPSLNLYDSAGATVTFQSAINQIDEFGNYIQASYGGANLNLSSNYGTQSYQFYNYDGCDLNGCGPNYLDYGEYQGNTFSKFISSSISNSTNSFSLGQVYAYAAVSGQSDDYSVIPVPEPETYAMLLGGLGLIGFAARIRKSA